MLRLLSFICALALVLAAPAWASGLGDCDGDNDVDRADAEQAQAAVGAAEGDEGFIPEADMDGDGVITVSDVSAILRASR